eukprot:11207572-Lingulodinium_polyedra.AAC.1
MAHANASHCAPLKRRNAHLNASPRDVFPRNYAMLCPNARCAHARAPFRGACMMHARDALRDAP